MKKLIILSLMASSLLFGSDDVQIDKLIQAVIPGTTISKVEKAEIDGLYKAFMPNGDLLYIEPNKKLIFFGQIWTTYGQSLTQVDVERWQQTLAQEQLKSISSERLLKDSLKVEFGKGSTQYDFVIFTDPECPYCKKAEETFLNKDVTVYYNFMPLDFHKNAKEWSLDILSSKNPKQTAEQIRAGKTVKVKHTKEAEIQLDKMVVLAKELGVTGTPKLFVLDKQSKKVVDIINGANIPQIQKYLKNM